MQAIPTTLFFVFLVVNSASAAIKIGGSVPLTGPDHWELVFSDEFDGTILNTKNWTTCYWWNDGGCTNLGNHELEWYLAKNVKTVGGHLKLTAQKETAFGTKGKSFNYTSGIVTSGLDYAELPRRPRFSFQYGQIEVRAKLPGGKGLWPAIWLLPKPTNTRPEIDIMEMLGDSKKLLRVHLHYNGADGNAAEEGKNIQVGNLSKTWHVFGVRWQPDVIKWYLDGVEVWHYDKAENIPKEPLYLLMNLAVGGDFPGEPDHETQFPAEFLVDYVRVWQHK